MADLSVDTAAIATGSTHEGPAPGRPKTGYVMSFEKLALDKILVCLALPPCLLVGAVIALLLWTTQGGPVLFAQVRIGRDGRRFNCLKFRTMVHDAEERLAAALASDPALRAEWIARRKLRDDPRISPLGRILRASSLDELPQILNVLIGDMSLVGPRPVVPDELKRYGHRKAAYLAVRPGLTGLWQVSGRSETSYRRRVALDSRYCRGATMRLDLLILCRTVGVLFDRRGAF